jgi:D-cysteine desulfhydrase
VQIRKVALEKGQLLVVQDDLLHPILGGNKLRKLDALLPEVKASGCTDLVRQAGQSTSQVIRQSTMV